MNANWIKNLGLTALGCALASATAAMAGPIGINVDFNCADGQGTKAGGGNICPSAKGGLIPISSWSQGFTGVQGPGSINIATTSTAVQGALYDIDTGDPAPALGSTKGTTTLTVTNTGDYLFTFQSIDLGANSDNGMKYTITGYDGATEEFTFSNQLCLAGCGPAPTYTWIGVDDTLYSNDLLTELVITVNANNVAMEDNLDVDAVASPEPGSLVLLGTGLLGLAFVAFRKSRNANLSLHS
jgi:hypothetical protein